jgi:hypothetical protein
VASSEPRTVIYDDYLCALGGDPDATLPAR